MKQVKVSGLLGLMFILMWVAMISIGLGMAALSLYGLYLAFSASVILGILALVIEPSPLVFGVMMFFFKMNVPQMLLEWFHKQ